jgi:hypothetical protein
MGQNGRAAWEFEVLAAARLEAHPFDATSAHAHKESGRALAHVACVECSMGTGDETHPGQPKGQGRSLRDHKGRAPLPSCPSRRHTPTVSTEVVNGLENLGLFKFRRWQRSRCSWDQ